jgi:hypothetical protein
MAVKVSRVKRESMFRDFLPKDKKYRPKNPMKNYRVVTNKYCKKYTLSQPMLMFMVWAYDLEFFTLDYASKQMKWNKGIMFRRCLTPLKAKNFVYKYFDKLTPSNNYTASMFREEYKMNYRVRYALTAEAVQIVKEYYKELASKL